MITVGVDCDGVTSLPRMLTLLMLTRRNERVFWWLQKFRFLQRLYNYFFRIANPEIREFMKELKEQGFGVVIISASNESYRQELTRWHLENGFCFDELYLKQTPNEDTLAYKKRMASLCVYYFDDNLEIVSYINNGIDGNSGCLAFLYQGQKKEELLDFYLSPIFKIFKTV